MDKSGLSTATVRRTVAVYALILLLAGQLAWLGLARSGRPGAHGAEATEHVVDLRGDALPIEGLHRLTAVAGASLEEQLAAATVVVAFLHPSCPDCAAARPVLEQLMAHSGGQVGFVGVFSGSPDEIENHANSLPGFVDEGRELFDELGVLSVPTVLVAQDGRVTFQSVGWSDEIARELAIAISVDLTGPGGERHAVGTRDK